MSDFPFLLQSYDYTIPEALVAERPAEPRDASKLMILGKEGEAQTEVFRNLGNYLPGSTAFVVNATRTAPMRLLGVKPSGGKAEALLLEWPGGARGKAEVDALVRNCRVGQGFQAGPLRIEVVAKGERGRARVRIEGPGELGLLIETVGVPPLPPYIKRAAAPEDVGRYQTVYAKAEHTGSAAAPTAGFHFTPELMASLTAAGHRFIEINLTVGLGTFSPVMVEDVREHPMHAERVHISEAAAEAIRDAKRDGLTLCAVGTTSVRTLESTVARFGEIRPFSGETDCLILPGWEFKAVEAMITNFHQPKSTLLMLVSAFSGRERILDAYAAAAQAGFRFFSYGDAMFLL